MTKFKEGDEVLVRATVKNVYDNGYFNFQVQANLIEGFDDNRLIKMLVQNAENCLIAQIQHPDITPASALDVNKELHEALEALLSKVECGSALSCPICEQAKAALKKARGEQ